MWLILLATVGAAALLTQWKSGRWKVELVAPRGYGELKVALPKGWEVRYDPRTRLLVADEVGGVGRRMRLSAIHADGVEDPLEFLIKSGALPSGVFESNPEIAREIEEVEIKNGEGILLHLPRVRMTRRGTAAMRDDALACLIFRDGRGALIQLSDPEANRKANDALIMGVAESVQMQDAKMPAPADDENSI